ncbi:MAG: hypothetical protein WC651_03035 [Candidatus Gracilibacteria bacterium]|jgi:hypothetical protein
MGKENKFNIPDTKLPATNLKFSFEFYDTSCNKYCLSRWPEENIAMALKRLKEICEKTFQELQRDRVTYRLHEIDWSQCREEGFPKGRINEIPNFQFSLLGINQQKARVFGGYADNTFFIVWFDLNHEIWPSFMKHT